eukprot:s1775_g7.t1
MSAKFGRMFHVGPIFKAVHNDRMRIDVGSFFVSAPKPTFCSCQDWDRMSWGRRVTLALVSSSPTEQQFNYNDPVASAPDLVKLFLATGAARANSDAEMPIVSDDSLGVDTGTQLGLLLK